MNQSSTQNNSDSEGSIPSILKYMISAPSIMLIGVLVLGLSILGKPLSSSGDVIYSAAEMNSQNIALLAPAFTVEPKQAIGGPEDIVIIENALESQLGLLKEGQAFGKDIPENNGISYYVVREGDTLSEIAETFDVSVNTIRWENNIKNTIRAGQELKILPVSGVRHTVKKGDTFGSIAVKYDAETDDIRIFNDLIKDTQIAIGDSVIVPNGIVREVKPTSSKGSSKSITTSSGSKAQSGYYRRPTTGPITSKFGPRKGSYHYGIDFGAPTGTPIVAAASGTVTKTSCGSGYGKCLVIKHGNGTQTLYAHASRLLVSAGTSVQQGQKVAEVGSTGRSTGPHLHFEIVQISSGKKLRPSF